jgi:short-subunit dehydrogenase
MKKAIIVGTSDFDIEKETIDLNVTVFTNIIGWTINYFEEQHYGHLAAITSAAGLRGSRQAPSYNASKSYQIKRNHA